jgi:hypothetical protein
MFKVLSTNFKDLSTPDELVKETLAFAKTNKVKINCLEAI